MREILFRARTVSESEYLDDGEWVEGFYTCFNGEEHRIYTGYSETDCGDYYPDWFNVLPETVGQYTGLYDNTKWEDLTHEEQKQFYYKLYPEYGKKDKYPPIGTVKHLWKGKPIFEGDIVKKSWLYTYIVGNRVCNKVNSFAGQISYNRGVFEIQEHGEVLGFLGDNDTLEVIGNIYENPELLNGMESESDVQTSSKS